MIEHVYIQLDRIFIIVFPYTQDCLVVSKLHTFSIRLSIADLIALLNSAIKTKS